MIFIIKKIKILKSFLLKKIIKRYLKKMSKIKKNIINIYGKEQAVKIFKKMNEERKQAKKINELSENKI